jgi:hypothetical protein
MKTTIKGFIIGAVAMCNLFAAQAQNDYDTIRTWQLDKYSSTTIDNLKNDDANWTLNSKGGRYQNVKPTDGNLLTENGTVIAETDSVWFSSGISAGSLLLCFNRGSGNGVQIQNPKPITLKGLKKGQIIEVMFRSSSSSAVGFKSATNLTGDIGDDFYTGTGDRSVTFKVVADGDVSMTNSGGIIIKKIMIMQERYTVYVETPVITVNGNTATITCAKKKGLSFVRYL